METWDIRMVLVLVSSRYVYEYLLDVDAVVDRGLDGPDGGAGALGRLLRSLGRRLLLLGLVRTDLLHLLGVGGGDDRGRVR
jgi:hypothetical protein